MDRIWKEIDGTGGRYSVSNDGLVKANWSDVPQRNSKKRIRIEGERILKACVHTTGYFRVSLGRNNSRYVHRLVAAAFIDNPLGLPQVDHIDGNRLNNCVSNLRWVTARQNALYGGERHGWASQKEATYRRCMDDQRREAYIKLRQEGFSYRHIARVFNTSHCSVKSVIERGPLNPEVQS